MNATEIAYLEARIEEEHYRKIEEAEAAYRRDMEALGVVRALYERYGDVVEAPEEGPAVSEALTASVEVSELQAAEEDGPGAVVDSGLSAPEHQLDPPDAAYVEEKIAIEVEGGTGWKRDQTSRHLTPSGFRGDVEKYNAAACMGWAVLRFTPAMLRDAVAIETIKRALKARPKERAS